MEGYDLLLFFIRICNGCFEVQEQGDIRRAPLEKGFLFFSVKKVEQGLKT